MVLNEKCGHETKVDEPSLTTDRAGHVYTTNGWGQDLASLTVRHRRANDPQRQEQKTFYNVASGSKVGPLDITYTTGAGSPFDYWWIKFELDTGRVFTIKDNFYCYISSADDGVVQMRLDGSDNELYVTFSSSSGCKVSVYAAASDSDGDDADSGL